MLKKEIRSMYRKRRDAITPAEQQKWDDLMLIQFQSVELPFADYILSFYPMEENREVNSFLFTDYLHFRNPHLQICYPRMRKEETAMDAIVCYPDTVFQTNSFNILEPLGQNIADPSDMDIVLVPLLAFDFNGVRVGYGKGYYDRYLQHCRPDCLKIGLSYFEPLDQVEDAGQFDVPLDLCITPQRVYVF